MTRRWDVREAQLDVQLEGLRQPTTCAAARSVGCRVATCRLGRSERRREAGGPLVPEESRIAKLP